MVNFNAVADRDLYEMCCQGDEGAWQYIYNYIYKCVMETCKKRNWKLRDDFDEMAQQITIHLLEKALKKVKETDKFRNFVRVVAVNKILDSFKVQLMQSTDKPVKNKKGEEFIPEYPDSQPLHDTYIFNLEIVSVIDTAIKKLSKDCQRVVNEYLKFKIGLYENYKELSKVLKMPIPTISSSVRRCLNKIVEFKEIKALRSV